MLIQFHILQNYAPSNLNRDDTGSPKDAMFGGALRGRISSQCLKRSMRLSPFFVEAFKANGLLGDRTKTLPSIINGELAKLTQDKEAIAAIVKRVPEIGRESKKRGEGEEAEDQADVTPAEGEETISGETKQLIFLDRTTEAPLLAERLLAIFNRVGAKQWEKTPIKDITKDIEPCVPRSVDIAMFGRMTTSQAFKDVHASVQVAHALSTNALKQEFDYYTAMDDLKPESEPGADMIGDVEFNSCCYYKYLNVHWEGLVKNLGGDVAIAQRGILALLKAAALAQPTGKQNSFAAHSLPDFVLVEVSERNLPVSYANAFLKPVRAFGEQTLVANSVSQLVDYVGRTSKVFGLDYERAYTDIQGQAFPAASRQESLAALQNWLKERLG